MEEIIRQIVREEIMKALQEVVLERSTSNTELKQTVMTIPEVASILGISKPHAYELAKRNDFPTFRIGRSIRVLRQPFVTWLESRTGEVL